GSAVIRPQLLRRILKKRSDMVIGTDRLLYDSPFIEIVIRQSVDDGEILQTVFHQSPRSLIRFQLFKRRLIRDMEIAALLNSKLSQLFCKGYEKFSEEGCVLLTNCRRLPSEEPAQPAVLVPHNFRRSRGSPLAEQVGHLKIFYTAASAHRYPALKSFISEPVPVLRYPYIYQLYGSPFSSLRCVERRGEDRRKDHIAAPAHRCPDKILHNPP